jgi:hypothetical protein
MDTRRDLTVSDPPEQEGVWHVSNSTQTYAHPILAAPDLGGTLYERTALALSIHEFDARSRHAQ